MTEVVRKVVNTISSKETKKKSPTKKSAGTTKTTSTARKTTSKVTIPKTTVTYKNPSLTEADVKEIVEHKNSLMKRQIKTLKARNWKNALKKR